MSLAFRVLTLLRMPGRALVLESALGEVLRRHYSYRCASSSLRLAGWIIVNLQSFSVPVGMFARERL